MLQQGQINNYVWFQLYQFFLNGKVQYYTILFLSLVTGREIVTLTVIIEKSFQWQNKYVG
jgi:hypothetical protein